VAILEIKKLRKSFGGLMAIEDINMKIQEHEVCSLIGPNGAGKTTLFNVISGRFPPDRGTIIFRGSEITGRAPHKIVSMGLGRTFQIINIFPSLSTFENIEVAIIRNLNRSLRFFRPVRRYQEIQEETWQILGELELTEKAEIIGGNLPYGDQRRLEIGIALANKPRLLLLDEPTSGMSPEETRSTVRLIERLAKERKMTLFIIEHDMEVVFSISERVLVLHQGTLIAEGPPEEVSNNQEVISAYLGE
jgi:branched-chain amino acid transport system ATP-binding protein